MSTQPIVQAPMAKGELRCLRAVAPPTPLAAHYRGLMGLAALVMLLLPLAYLGLVGAVGAAGWWWALEGGAFLPQRGVTSHGSLSVLLRFGPCLLSLLVCLALVKPLLVRRPRREQDQVLERAEQPQLFAYVEQLADLIGAPKPQQIRVNLEVNASAGLTRGWRSLLSGDLTLTLGLPLVAGLDLRQLTAVIAHELGHFSQAAGMRSTFVIRSLEAWFQRVVFERDAFDRHLDRLARNPGHMFTLALLQATRGSIWLARRLLLGLMHVGALISRALMRQMEFDADSQAVRIAGSQAFASGLREISLLDRASHGAGVDADLARGDGKLPDDWTELVLLNLEQMPAEVRAQTNSPERAATASMYATHPPTAQRIARAVSADLSSGVDRDGPAQQLFADFVSLARRLTAEHFRAQLGPAFAAHKLHPARCLGRDVSKTLERIDALRAEFDLLVQQPHLLPWGALKTQPSASQWAGLAHLRAVEASLRPGFYQSLNRLGERAAERRVKRLVAIFEQAKVPIKREKHGMGKQEALPGLGPDDHIQDALLDSVELQPYCDAIEGQLLAALLAYEARYQPMVKQTNAGGDQPRDHHSDQASVPQESPSADLLAAGHRALATLRLLGSVAGQAAALHATSDLLQAAGPVLTEEAKQKTGAVALAQCLQRESEMLQRLQSALSGPAYPYEHSEPGISFEKALFGGLDLHSTSNDTLLRAAGTVFNKLLGLQVRALADLFVLARALEGEHQAENRTA
jgi:Zn-dependent protease with chaperone function